MPKSKPRKDRGQGRIQLTKDGIIRNVTTYPLMRKDKKGEQHNVPRIKVNW